MNKPITIEKYNKLQTVRYVDLHGRESSRKLVRAGRAFYTLAFACRDGLVLQGTYRGTCFAESGEEIKLKTRYGD